MKEKDLNVALLLDFYGEVLTQKQRRLVELYYDEDLSLAEISELTGTTRQGVRDGIKRGEAVLYDMEQKLGLSARFSRIRGSLEKIMQDAAEIAEYGERSCGPKKVVDRARAIESRAKALLDADI